jgi:hypothetical protein
MVGINVESLGGRIGDDGKEMLLVRSPQLTAGDLIVTTHMPNAIDGLRVETVGDQAVAATSQAPTGDTAAATEVTR